MPKNERKIPSKINRMIREKKREEIFTWFKGETKRYKKELNKYRDLVMKLQGAQFREASVKLACLDLLADKTVAEETLRLQHEANVAAKYEITAGVERLALPKEVHDKMVDNFYTDNPPTLRDLYYRELT